MFICWINYNLHFQSNAFSNTFSKKHRLHFVKVCTFSQKSHCLGNLPLTCLSADNEKSRARGSACKIPQTYLFNDQLNISLSTQNLTIRIQMYLLAKIKLGYQYLVLIPCLFRILLALFYVLLFSYKILLNLTLVYYHRHCLGTNTCTTLP